MSKSSPGHEVLGVNVRGVGVFILCFIMSGIALLGGLALVMGKIVGRERNNESPTSPISALPLRMDQSLQPSPGHANLDWQDTAAMKESQIHELNSYAPIAGDSGHIKIPIDRAIQLLVERRMLARPKVAPDTESSTRPYINTTQPASTENRT